ncbi:ubiquitin-conjugating enzyme E2 J1 [Frankliniella occidentalis]|uniref:Ubiquitin-conjugating enzyme E2 J1 n=1 Tax=Frankliniella occidentalis TaxID=133901 RepID=A0A6J1T928_FRAOC|nr:ubiquitin-conjugating enzyme E2 J1 [Frankliniella occidentalis]
MDQYQAKYNTKSTSVKRLMREAKELQEATEDYCAHPLEENLFEWHFTIRGPPDSDFSGGVYHGRILLPAEYPMKPPNIILLTPNGRFEVNKKICLSISGHHPETWQPSWSIRTALLALIAFMPTPGIGTIGSLDFTPEERKQLALKSQSFVCSDCGKITEELATGVSKPVTEEEKSLIDCVAFKEEEVHESNNGEADPPSSSVSESSQSELRVRKPYTADSAPGQASGGPAAVESSNSLNSQTVQPQANTGNINLLDRHRSLIILFIVTAIGLLVFRRLIMI